MKKNLILLASVVTLAFTSPAALILNEPFNYANGALTTVSSGLWANHSGTAGQVDVANGVVNVTELETEDVNRLLPGGPYTNGTLYFSFAVNFSRLPSGTGNYFAHLKDSSASNFRTRIFASTNNSPPGMFRFGLSMVSAASGAYWIERDLNTNTEYFVVVRYILATPPAATLWVNPTNEADLTTFVNFTDDTVTNMPIYAFALRQSLSSGAGMGTLTFDRLKVATTFAEVMANPPAISYIPNQSIPANTNTGPLPFTVSDAETTPAELTLSGDSSNPTLVPVQNVVFGGSGANRTVTITPVPGQQGVTVITVAVRDDDGNVTSWPFLVQVGAPSISQIADQVTCTNTPLGPLAFTVSDPESAPDSLTLTAFSTNQALVTDGKIVFSGSGVNRAITITPESEQSGLTKIYLVVSDGINSVTNSFMITVAPYRGIDLADDFDYADGSVHVNSLYFWNHTSGSDTQEMQITSGQLQVTMNQSQDVAATMTNAPYLSSSGYILYSKFEVNCSVLPTAADGEYFAHFKDNSTGYRARIFATTNGAAAGMFRLGIANTSARPSAVVALDLAGNTTYVVVTRYNVGTGQSTLWLNPTSESDPGAVATDSTSTTHIYSYAFRQHPGIGTMLIDKVRVGTAFSDVVPPIETVRVGAARSGASLVISWPITAGFALEQTASLAPANWQPVGQTPTVSGGQNYVTNALQGSAGYFRLRKP